MYMTNKDIKAGFIDLITANEFTHSMTLKPNAAKAAAAGPVFQILSGDERFQLTASTASTLNYTKYVGEDNFSDSVLRSKLWKFHGILDRSLVGRRYHKPQNKHLRTQIIAVCEGNNLTGHLHCAIRVHESRLEKFNMLFPEAVSNSEGKRLWNKVATGGTVQVDEIYDLTSWAGYMAKSLAGNNASDRIILSI